MPAGAERPPYLTVGLVSGAAVGLEILLMRLLPLIHGQQFAAMVISLALLGIGAAGVFLSLAGSRLTNRAGLYVTVFAALFGVSAPVSFALAACVPFNPLEAPWDPAQWGRLFAVYLTLSVPFFFSGSCAGLALARWGGRAGAVYGADLAGAGLGAAGALTVLWAAHPEEALAALPVLGFAAACACAPGRMAGGGWAGLALALCGLASWLFFPMEAVRPVMSEYKGLPQALAVAGTRVTGEDYSPYGLVSLTRQGAVPLRFAPGLDPSCKAPIPSQTGVYLDGDFYAALLDETARPDSLAFLDCLPTALAWKLHPGARTLVLQAGSGLGTLEALVRSPAGVDAVEANPRLPVLEALPPGTRAAAGMKESAGARESAPALVHRDGARPFLARPGVSWGIIAARLHGSGGQALAVRGAAENFDFTVEGVRAMLGRLEPGGLLMVSLWPSNPPVEAFKLAATIALALEEDGVTAPGRRMLVVRGVNALVFLVKTGDFGPGEQEIVRDFLAGRSLSLAFAPKGFAPDSRPEADVREDSLEAGLGAILGPGRERFLAEYKFHISPATDASPFFSRFARPGTLPELWALRGRGGAPLLQWGYISLIAVALSALAAGALLLLAPAALAAGAWRKDRPGEAQSKTRPGEPEVAVQSGRDAPGGRSGIGQRLAWRALVYFLALGLAFLFVEMACLQQLGLLTGAALWQASVALGAFLVFAGIGAVCSRGVRPGLALAAAAFCGASLLFILPLGLPWLSGLSQAARAGCAALVIAPAAFFMGMPFAQGIARLHARTPELVPWAYGVNAFASVLSPPLAALLAMHAGLPWVGLAAGALYLLAWRALPPP